jgi:hypothetical protein
MLWLSCALSRACAYSSANLLEFLSTVLPLPLPLTFFLQRPRAAYPVEIAQFHAEVTLPPLTTHLPLPCGTEQLSW